MRHHQPRLIIAIVATALVAVPGVASAATTPVAAPPTQVSIPAAATAALPAATAEQVTGITDALDAKGVPSVTSPLIGTVRTTYTLPSGSTVVVERPRTMPGTVTPQWSVSAGWGLYIYLNQVDQKAVYNGGAAALGILICGSTGLIACAAATGALVAAATYFDERGGICPKRLEIRIITTLTLMKCVN